MVYSNDTTGHLFTYEVISNFDVFRAVTISGVVYHSNSGHVVLIKDGGFGLRETEAKQ